MSTEHIADYDAGTRPLPWLGNLLIDLIEWVTLTSGFGFREYRRLGADGRRRGGHYWRESRILPPGEGRA